jgi:hypothetical protein
MVLEREEQIWLKLAKTPNYLSMRLTPQRDETKLTRAPELGAWSARQIIQHLRDTEARTYPKMHAIATLEYPDLGSLPAPSWLGFEPEDLTLTVLSQFRRIRMTTIALLRELPRDAWQRLGRDADGQNVTIEDLALWLLNHDAEHTAQLDATLIARGALPFNVTPLVAG